MTKLFTQTLADINQGGLVAELSDELAALVKAIRNTGKKGSLTLKLELCPAKGNAGQLGITPRVKCDLPKLDTSQDWFFGLASGDLSRHHPDQGELPLRIVERVDPEIGEIRPVERA